jgi:hypothetical protein
MKRNRYLYTAAALLIVIISLACKRHPVLVGSTFSGTLTENSVTIPVSVTFTSTDKILEVREANGAVLAGSVSYGEDPNKIALVWTNNAGVMRECDDVYHEDNNNKLRGVWLRTYNGLETLDSLVLTKQ